MYDFDFGATNMLLNFDPEDNEFVHNVHPAGVGIGSDVWGFVNKYIDGSLLKSDYYSLVTTEKGMVTRSNIYCTQFLMSKAVA